MEYFMVAPIAVAPTGLSCEIMNLLAIQLMSSEFSLDDGPQGALDGQTDNPNSDFNVTVRCVPSNTPSKSNLKLRISLYRHVVALVSLVCSGRVLLGMLSAALARNP